MSFVGDDVEPVFVLEVRGTAVVAGGAWNDYHIVHGPKASACAAAPGCEAPCPPLVLGSQQAGRDVGPLGILSKISEAFGDVSLAAKREPCERSLLRSFLGARSSRLDPQHLMLEAAVLKCLAVFEVEDAAERRFFLRNLSKLPIRVEGTPEDLLRWLGSTVCQDGFELSRLQEDGRWQLHHGGSIESLMDFRFFNR